MILIADSGSTKTAWRSIDVEGQIGQYKTAGMNPYYQDTETMYQDVKNNLVPQIEQPVEEIHFYGAGCVTPDDKAQVTNALSQAFDTKDIEVQDDLLGAARASCGTEPGIACILGTGSNSCLYDGTNIQDRIPPLGFILGDEGSGSYLGRQLVSDFLKRVMPEPVRSQFEERYSPDKGTILESVYKGNFPNRYLAGYSQFALHHLNDPYIHNLVSSGFELFFARNVQGYRSHQQLPINFVGSIAFYYSDLLRRVASDMGLLVKNILESPIAGLTLYHQARNS